jgi:hypothetical protein
MSPKIKYGLIVGVVGLVVNICVSAAVGVCGPFTALIAGGVAGFLTAQAEKTSTKGDGARAGAVAGVVAGALVLVGQLIGSIGALFYFQSTGTPTLFGELPQAGDTAGQVGFWIGGLGFGFCAGLFGVALGALAGAGAGYLGTPAQPSTGMTIDNV